MFRTNQRSIFIAYLYQAIHTVLYQNARSMILGPVNRFPGACRSPGNLVRWGGHLYALFSYGSICVVTCCITFVSSTMQRDFCDISIYTLLQFGWSLVKLWNPWHCGSAWAA
ncbi:hypothetical protein BD414DRAFT_484190 [Trametes punicea]|nr:hypothetical protein BD414DRAFT_484190 [Trametes punicea]